MYCFIKGWYFFEICRAYLLVSNGYPHNAPLLSTVCQNSHHRKITRTVFLNSNSSKKMFHGLRLHLPRFFHGYGGRGIVSNPHSEYITNITTLALTVLEKYEQFSIPSSLCHTQLFLAPIVSEKKMTRFHPFLPFYRTDSAHLRTWPHNCDYIFHGIFEILYKLKIM